jgi:hypothetical protein
MPKWAKTVLWILVVLVAIARWRDIASWLGDLAASIKTPFDREMFCFEDPVVRFAAFGILMVTVVALWKIYWSHRWNRRQ